MCLFLEVLETVTHHHAVGRDHRVSGYDHQIPNLFNRDAVGSETKN